MFEARERVGGRVWSGALDNGAVVEMGAEYILPGNTAVRELAARLGLGLWDKGMAYGRREPRADGHQPRADGGGRPGDRACARGRPAGVSAQEFLDGLDIDAGTREALLARVEISSASRPQRSPPATSPASPTSTKSPPRASRAATRGWRSGWRRSSATP